MPKFDLHIGSAQGEVAARVQYYSIKTLIALVTLDSVISLGP